MIDDNQIDDKIIAIPFKDPTWNYVNKMEDIPQHLSEEMEHFFQVYKALEHKETTVLKVLGKDDALQIIKRSMKRYDEEFDND